MPRTGGRVARGKRLELIYFMGPEARNASVLKGFRQIPGLHLQESSFSVKWINFPGELKNSIESFYKTF